ncbi:glycosyltransferase family 4 protein [Aerosakkonemataceae cyanobacterium BLCC-F50]|uniref:Glycosyltransferase family 4 protein n=1 Tax=Floridaenema flaviceps BLCC-F50 TaxID=3153642 RepID=A0ABV4XYE0_9CYAN
MKVVYDLSRQAKDFYATKSGLFRYAENLALGLAKSPECDLKFCAGLSIEAWQKSLSYLKANSEFQGIPFISQETEQITGGKLYQLMQKTIKSTHKLGFRRTRILEDNFLNLISLTFPSINPKDLADREIYHSPFYGIPKQVEQCKNIKKFLTVHDLIPIRFPQFCPEIQTIEQKKILGRLNSDSWIICVSEYVKNDLCDYLKTIDPAKVIVTYLGASENFHPCSDPQKIAEVRQKYNIPDGSYILSLSMLEPRKNTLQTIRCFENLIKSENIKDLYLVLAGKKSRDFPKVWAEISSEPILKERIIVTDFVAAQDLPALYSGAIVFVYLSFCEGFGLPPLEAMQCGTPVITSNTTSIPEVVGEAGIAIDPQDSDRLCHNILQIYNHPSLRKDLSLKSIEQAKKFSWSKCIEQTIAAYKKSLS